VGVAGAPPGYFVATIASRKSRLWVVHLPETVGEDFKIVFIDSAVGIEIQACVVTVVTQAESKEVAKIPQVAPIDVPIPVQISYRGRGRL
jgi:hypothetical protein